VPVQGEGAPDSSSVHDLEGAAVDQAEALSAGNQQGALTAAACATGLQ